MPLCFVSCQTRLAEQMHFLAAESSFYGFWRIDLPPHTPE
ncbi:hypothetical protein APS_1192 [Acetobacter pasteurianus subsp. pasteurianus LMG 1262 = NBRC 106471]|nr:hypothetical protein ApDm4_0103 [Acetobacter pomorum]GAB30590.1 hypothetical protein APS_1192 [Acetobacter pasteurianus subsp. pasteurianus LMG 1262 = NBRC 106471]